MCHRGTFATFFPKKEKKEAAKPREGTGRDSQSKKKIIKLIHNKLIEIPVYFFVLLCDLQF